MVLVQKFYTISFHLNELPGGDRIRLALGLA